MKRSAKSGFAIRHHLAQILHDDGTDFDRTREYRVQVFIRLALPCLVYFLINDLILGSYGTSMVILVCIALQGICAFQLKKPDRLDSACRYFMLSLCLLLGSSHLWDGQLNSMSLWLIPVLPMSAAFLIGAKSAVLYLGVANGIVCAAMVSSKFITTEQMLEDTEVQCLAIRISGMIFFGASGLLSHQTTRNQRRLLKSQQEQVERIQQEHDSAVAAKNAFFANISHEIRTPMNGILGMTQHLLRCSLPARARDSVKTMHDCAQDLLALLNKILDLSALEMGDRVRQIRVLDFTQEIQAQIQELQAQGQGQGLSFQEPGHEVKIRVDQELLQKTIRIVLDDASQMALHGNVSISVATDPCSSNGLGGELAIRYRSRKEDTGLTRSYLDVAHHSDAVHAARVSLSIAAQLATLMGAQLDVTQSEAEGQQEVFLRFIDNDEQLQGRVKPKVTPGGFVSRALDRIHQKLASLVQNANRSESSAILLGIHLLAGPAIFVYILDAYFHNHPTALQVYLGGTWLWVIGAILNYRTKHTKAAAWMTVAGALILMAFLNLADGQIRSESLWILPLIPVGALFILGTRAFYATFGIGVLIILGVFLATIYLPVEQEYEETFAYVLGLRMVTLQIYGGMCVLAAYVSRRYYLQYKKKRLAMLVALRASQRAHSEKSKFLTNMSHEIRTPMNGILGLAESLVDQGLPKEQHHTISTIHRCGGHLLALLGEVLDLSELSKTTQRLSKVPMNLSVLLSDVQNLFQASASLKDISIQTIGDNLDLPVIGDPTRLMQVLSNLVGNAIKFSDHGLVVIAVTRAEPCARDKRDGYDIKIEIRDQGIGIPASKVDDLFCSFVQVEASSGPQRGGTGLGLAISRRLVRAMGGDLDVESELGKGSVFRLHFWLESAKDSDDAAIESQSIPEALLVDDATARTLLVVDDNPINRKVAVMFLERFGFAAKVAHNGLEAVQMAESTQFDAILMDVRMPGMDGIEATKAIRKGQGLCADVPIIAFSADNYEEQKRLCIEAGMNAHLAKPFRADELKAKLQALWNQPRSDEAAA